MQLNKYVVEFIGTFFLVLTVALSRNPIAIGAVLIAMVYMGGYISGAHYNPAVTLGVYLRGKIDLKNGLFYWLAQLLGGLAAAGFFYYLAKNYYVPTASANLPFLASTLCEAIFTFALVSVVLHVATSDKIKDNYYYGAAIGLTVMAAGFAIGQVTSAVLNPAIAVGPILLDYKHYGNSAYTSLAMYTVGPFVGAILAALVYRYTTLVSFVEKTK